MKEKRGVKLFRGKKADFSLDNLGPWIIGVLFLALIVVGYILLKGKGFSMSDFINNLFRFK